MAALLLQIFSFRPGEKRTVRFVLNSRDLSLVNQDMQRVAEPEAFEVMVGGLKKRFQVV